VSLCLCGILLLSGCSTNTGPRSPVAAQHYYRHDYPAARDAVRQHATDRTSGEVILDNLRLGMAALADGDGNEAERALLRAYEYLISGGVNQPDRAVASTVLYEGIRVWKGEPFEQAMAFYHIAALYMVKGDWENARAAANNALFALRDIRAESDEATDLIESDFTLGYLVSGLGAMLSGREDLADRAFGRAQALDNKQAKLIETLRGKKFDTLLLVDLGRGPILVAYGDAKAETRYEPDGRQVPLPTASVQVDGQPAGPTEHYATVDLWTLAQQPKWWSRAEPRRFRRDMGNVLLIGGLVAAVIGEAADSDEAK